MRVYYPATRVCYHTIDNVIRLITSLAARYGKEKYYEVLSTLGYWIWDMKNYEGVLTTSKDMLP